MTATLHIAGRYNTKTQTGGWGVVIEDDRGTREYQGREHSSCQGRIQLLGFLRALQCIAHLPSHSQVHVHTDCQKIADGVDGLALKWQAAGWRSAKGRPISHSAVWRKIVKLMSRFDCSVTYHHPVPDEHLLGRASHLAHSRSGSESPVSVYVDGSFMPEYAVGGWSVVQVDDGQVTEDSGSMTVHDNNLIELVAAVHALEGLNPGRDVILYTDSQYVSIGAKLIDQWKQSHFRSESGTLLKYAKWWLILDDNIKRLNVRIEWVKGHSGVMYNVRADRLAKKAARHMIANRIKRKPSVQQVTR